MACLGGSFGCRQPEEADYTYPKARAQILLYVVADTDAPTAIESVVVDGKGGAEPVSKHFYTIDGMQVSKPAHGLVIVETVYSDGSIVRKKTIIK